MGEGWGSACCPLPLASSDHRWGDPPCSFGASAKAWLVWAAFWVPLTPRSHGLVNAPPRTTAISYIPSGFSFMAHTTHEELTGSGGQYISPTSWGTLSFLAFLPHMPFIHLSTQQIFIEYILNIRFYSRCEVYHREQNRHGIHPHEPYLKCPYKPHKIKCCYDHKTSLKLPVFSGCIWIARSSPVFSTSHPTRLLRLASVQRVWERTTLVIAPAFSPSVFLSGSFFELQKDFSGPCPLRWKMPFHHFLLSSSQPSPGLTSLSLMACSQQEKRFGRKST